jgi:hypothetical protein
MKLSSLFDMSGTHACEMLNETSTSSFSSSAFSSLAFLSNKDINNKNIKNINKNLNKYLKGQIFSYDAIVGGVLFAVLLTLLFVYWDAIRSFVFLQIDDLFRVALHVSDNLMTPGIPPDWNTTTVSKVGISEQYGSAVINDSKFGNLTLLASTPEGYEKLRTMLNVGAYELYLTLNSTAKNVAIGAVPTGAKGEIKIVRPVVYRDRPANLTIDIWTNVSS